MPHSLPPQPSRTRVRPHAAVDAELNALGRQRRWLGSAACALGLGLALTGCAGLMGPRTIEISQDELIAKLGKRFPLTQKVMNLLDISITAPSLAMLPDTNRVAATIPLTAKDLLQGRDYQGLVALSFGLRYEPSDLSIRLTGVKVDEVRIEGLPPLYQNALIRLGTSLLEGKLQDYPVHHFTAEDLRRADRMGYEVGDIHVTRTGLAIQLQPRHTP